MPRLLHLVGQGQGTDPPRRRKGTPSPALSLTDAEASALRASIRNIARARFGTFAKLAAAIGVRSEFLTRKRRPSAALALAVARVADMSVDAVLGRTGLALVPPPVPPPSLPGGAS
jgi:hypothetical protein